MTYSTARAGRDRENRVRDQLVARGWFLVARSAGSKGAADLILVHPLYGLALVQVGTETSKRLGPAERDRLVDLAELCSALPLLASTAPGRPTRFRLVSRDPASTWKDYTP